MHCCKSAGHKVKAAGSSLHQPTCTAVPALIFLAGAARRPSRQQQGPGCSRRQRVHVPRLEQICLLLAGLPAWTRERDGARRARLRRRHGTAAVERARAEAVLVHGVRHGPLDGVQAQVEQDGPDPGHNHVRPARARGAAVARARLPDSSIVPTWLRSQPCSCRPPHQPPKRYREPQCLAATGAHRPGRALPVAATRW